MLSQKFMFNSYLTKVNLQKDKLTESVWLQCNADAIFKR